MLSGWKLGPVQPSSSLTLHCIGRPAHGVFLADFQVQDGDRLPVVESQAAESSRHTHTNTRKLIIVLHYQMRIAIYQMLQSVSRG